MLATEEEKESLTLVITHLERTSLAAEIRLQDSLPNCSSLTAAGLWNVLGIPQGAGEILGRQLKTHRFPSSCTRLWA